MKKLFVYLIIFFITLLVIGFLFLKIFIVEGMDCKAQPESCDSNLQISISNLQKKHENVFQTYNDLNSILKNNRSVLKYSIELKLPLRFNVNVIERKAIVAFAQTNGKYVLVDRDGIVIGETAFTMLPKINSIPLTGDELIYVSNLVAILRNFYGVNTAKITADGIQVDNIQGKKVVFPLQGDIDVLMGSLSLIISRLPTVTEASTISMIDLRYKNPVLR